MKVSQAEIDRFTVRSVRMVRVSEVDGELLSVLVSEGAVHCYVLCGWVVA